MQSVIHRVITVAGAGQLCQARRWVGVRPLRWLFDLLRGPVATVATSGVRWRGLLRQRRHQDERG